MINKKLLSFDRKALHYVGLNVLFQWLGMLCNIIFVRVIAQLVGAVFAGGLTHEMLRQDFVLCLFTIPLRYVFTLLASSMSDCASKDVKRTLRSKIYEKLTRLGAGYSETIATSEAVMLASEGVEQIDTYICEVPAPAVLQPAGPGHPLRVAGGRPCAVGHHPAVLCAAHPHVHRGGAEICQKAAGKILGREYTTLGDSFLENIQGPDHPEDLPGRRLEA